jgi:hypothetical protein
MYISARLSLSLSLSSREPHTRGAVVPPWLMCRTDLDCFSIVKIMLKRPDRRNRRRCIGSTHTCVAVPGSGYARPLLAPRFCSVVDDMNE